MNAFSASFLSPLSPNPKFTTSTITPSRLHNLPVLNAHNSSSPETPTKVSFPSKFFNAVDGFIRTHVCDPLVNHPRNCLPDNTEPVHELPPTECTVTLGSLPSCLDGAYIRNGPNPQFIPRGPYHLFNGDGMLHSIKISGGKATFCSRFVKTYKYVTEKNAGLPLIPNFISDFNNLKASAAACALSASSIISGKYNFAKGIGLANTSLSLFGGKLYALFEADLPYEIKLTQNGDIITLGRHDFKGTLTSRMTAHPKIDPETGEAFAFRNEQIPPYLTLFRINPDGTKEPDVKIGSMNRPTFLHDFAITKNYAIFCDIQIEICVGNIMAGKSPVGADMSKVTRVGVIPRYAKNESGMKWFDVPGFNIVHTINAWEEHDGDTVVLVATNVLSIENFPGRIDLLRASAEKVEIDLKAGMVRRRPVAFRNLEVGVINPVYVGKKNRYVYAAIGDPFPKISGVVKLDLSLSQGDPHDCIVASQLHGSRCYGGEPFFVAKEPNNPNAEEDDGYLLSYVHDENKGESTFIVMDAKSPNLEIIASVKLPQRVPCGFHGLFIKESDLNKL